jgi:hypothetical protein
MCVDLLYPPDLDFGHIMIYLIDGALVFPTAEGPRAWRNATVKTWKGKGKVTVDQVLGWAASEAIVDESAPPEFRNAFFLDVTNDGPAVTIRGFIHRDSATDIGAVTEVAAEVGAKGKVRMHHLFDHEAGIRLEARNGSVITREGDVKIPSHVVEEIEGESVLRATKLRASKTPQPLAKTAKPVRTKAQLKPVKAKTPAPPKGQRVRVSAVKAMLGTREDPAAQRLHGLPRARGLRH